MARDVLQEWPDARLEDYWTGYRAGVERGLQIADERDERAAREAARIVHRMAELPPVDRDAAGRRRAASEAFWAARRGEGVA